MRVGITEKITEKEKKFINIIKPDFHKSFENVDNLIESGEEFDIILCNIYKVDACIDSLKKIRRSNLFLTPVYFPIEIDKNFSSDGEYTDTKQVLEKTENIISVLETLQKRNTSNWQEKVLFFLYTRPDMIIESEASITRKTYYYYPLLETFSEDEAGIVWLEELLQQGFIDKIKLKDKIYSCNNCNSITLKFTPHCPECNSINIKDENFLHCFTCGFNGSEEEFLKKNKLICPNCQTNLRLYGSDYDRPLENLICLDCKNVFIEPNTKVTCLSCGKFFSANELKIIDIYDLKLSKIGSEKIRQGMHSLDYFTDSNNFMAYDLFLSTLDWFIRTQARYKNQSFELIGIKLPLNNLTDYNFFQLFCKSLYAKIREVDITTRAPDGTIWIIFPFINKNSEAVLFKKLKGLYSEFNSDYSDIHKSSIKHVNFFSSQENVNKINSNILISQLSGNL